MIKQKNIYILKRLKSEIVVHNNIHILLTLNLDRKDLNDIINYIKFINVPFLKIYISCF